MTDPARIVEILTAVLECVSDSRQADDDMPTWAFALVSVAGKLVSRAPDPDRGAYIEQLQQQLAVAARSDGPVHVGGGH